MAEIHRPSCPGAEITFVAELRCPVTEPGSTSVKPWSYESENNSAVSCEAEACLEFWFLFGSLRQECLYEAIKASRTTGLHRLLSLTNEWVLACLPCKCLISLHPEVSYQASPARAKGSAEGKECIQLAGAEPGVSSPSSL